MSLVWVALTEDQLFLVHTQDYHHFSQGDFFLLQLLPPQQSLLRDPSAKIAKNRMKNEKNRPKFFSLS